MPYFEYVKPGFKNLFTNLLLDKKYIEAKGNYLYYTDKNNLKVSVLDFVGGYGSLLLGHNNQEINDHVKNIIDSNIPIHSQLSVKGTCGILAEKISNILMAQFKEKYISIFTNSGAETVEAAIKYLRFLKKNELDRIFAKTNSRYNYIESLNTKGSIKRFDFDGIEETFEAFFQKVEKHNQQIFENFNPVALSSEKGYHGKTFAALGITYNRTYRNPVYFPSDERNSAFFQWEIEKIEKSIRDLELLFLMPVVDENGIVTVQKIGVNQCLGIFIEPIQGEGGVVEVPQFFLESLRKLCTDYRTLLIIDEIQTGFFRTGEFLLCIEKRIKPDCVLIGKSVGGGLAKLSILCISEKFYDKEFCLIQTSTFSEDDYSAAIALKAFSILEKKVDLVLDRSAYIKLKLEELKSKHPEIIAEVLGKGLMLGLRFKDFNFSQSYFLQFVSRSGYFNYFLVSFLLNNYNIRVGSTLSENFTIRIQPSIFITDQEVDLLITAIDAFCLYLSHNDLYKIIEHLLPESSRDRRPLQKFPDFGNISLHTDPAAYKVGFLAHYIDENNIRVADLSLSCLTDEELNDLLSKVVYFKSSIVLGSQVINNQKGDKIEIIFSGLPFTSKIIRDKIVEGNLLDMRSICYNAIETLYSDFKVKIVGLGQYSSVLTNDGLTIPSKQVRITTGNSYTVYVGLMSMLENLKKFNQFNNEIYNFCIVGAAGNISSVYAKCITRYANKVYLKGSDSIMGYKKVVNVANEILKYVLNNLQNSEITSWSNLEKDIRNSEFYNWYIRQANLKKCTFLYEEFIKHFAEHSPIKVIKDISAIMECNAVVIATNDPNQFLSIDDFAPNTVICDISVPNNVDKSIIINNKNVKVIFGGVIKLPNGEGLPLIGFPLEPGYSYACIAETILLGFEKLETNFSFGSILPHQVFQIGEIGNKNNFYIFKEKEQSNF